MPDISSLDQAIAVFDLESAAVQVRYAEQERQRILTGFPLDRW